MGGFEDLARGTDRQGWLCGETRDSPRGAMFRFRKPTYPLELLYDRSSIDALGLSFFSRRVSDMRIGAFWGGFMFWGLGAWDLVG